MSQRLFLFSLLVFLISSCISEKEKEVYLFSYFQDNGQDGLHLAYSDDALNWTAINDNQSFLSPKVGESKLMRDPCLIRGADGKFHMVWTAGWTEQGIGYAYSEDLVNWSNQQYIPVMEHEPSARNCWAPELFYDAASEQYMIYWSTTIPGKFPATDNSGDKGYNHRMYYVTTKDFKEFSKTKLLYDHGFNVIDGTIQKIGKEYILFLKNEIRYPEPEKNIRIAKSQNLTNGYSPATMPITEKGVWVEGPTAIETVKGWIVYFDKYRKHQMGAMISKDLENWTDISEKISFPEGTRHGTVLKIKKQELDNLLH